MRGHRESGSQRKLTPTYAKLRVLAILVQIPLPRSGTHWIQAWLGQAGQRPRRPFKLNEDGERQFLEDFILLFCIVLGIVVVWVFDPSMDNTARSAQEILV